MQQFSGKAKSKKVNFIRHLCSIALLSTLITGVLPQGKVQAYDYYGQENTGVLREDFNGNTLDPKKWLIAAKQWGGLNNNGVVPENVKVENGNLLLEAHGDLYNGPVKGLYKPNKNKENIAPYHLAYNVDTVERGNKRVGAAIASKAYMGSGRYTMSAKIIPDLGVASTMWSFHYQEYNGSVGMKNGVKVASGDPEYIRAFKEGRLLPDATGAYPEYYAYNHEIDIEVPGRPAGPHTGQSYDRALLNTFTGEGEHEYSTIYANLGAKGIHIADGNYHKFEYRWHTGGNGETPRVDYYIDDQYIATNTTTLPTNAGRLWLGVWFPDAWAGGSANFDVKQMAVDYFEFEPYHEPNDTWMPESFPDDGWEDSDFRPLTANAINTRWGTTTGEFRDNFDGTWLDSSKWKVAKKNWGGILGSSDVYGQSWNGGVHPDNVALDGQGHLLLKAHGDYYNGLPLGINTNGVPRNDGKRVGSAIATSRYYGSGEYEVRMKIPKVISGPNNEGLPHGAVPAIWTFHYQEMDATSPEAEQFNADPNADYWVSNNEIDMEFPGRPGPTHTGMTFNKALFNTWQGENETEYHTNYTNLGTNVSDNEWHTYKIIWQIADPAHNIAPYVQFLVDGVIKYTADATKFIPTKPGRLWLGYWFPKNWGGKANFSEAQLEIDYVNFKPYATSGAVTQQESYPMSGWAANEEYPGYCVFPCASAPVADTVAPSTVANLVSPSKTDTSIQLSWTASVDNIGVTGYDIYKNNSLFTTVTGTTAVVSGLTASTTYNFYVKAKDAAGNISAASNLLAVTTNPAAANLVQNGDFSSGLVNNSTQGWKSTQTGVADVTGGTLNLHPSVTDISEVEQIVTVTPSQPYNLTGSIWRTGDPTYGYVYVYDGNQIIAQDFTNATKTIALTFTPTSNQLRVVLQAYKQQTGVFHYDNLILTTQ
ncbi:family 16 glycosylhydrolase [Paenibacillus oryzisoli]|uniref:GH16 domain-containing protein n=1 Tax=Paenibacillus oryzisoli TaxID=1850517 RepID=A0A198A163_9BACL|nr:family 16 glycosylhydrolase [Paenibacillus oryzisoli]OAS14915.1 hypothetical protein A8708_05295 [Paenibacillus oryzisoli]